MRITKEGLQKNPVYGKIDVGQLTENSQKTDKKLTMEKDHL